ncbi:DUF2267 domain-containing protein [Amycolatopsis samaneae]|uniref:DUF2267 domain-containing protein n=1 Tax=Amycolatopsis samaneae TaxID=664691 RepID=A0ABW5GRA6_9PSEU
MNHQHDPLAHAVHSAHEWLAAIADRLGTGDRHHTYRVLRAWLHLLRDRLTADAAAHFAAQLPELLRGVYFEGWAPSRVPIRYTTTEFVGEFAHEAGIAVDDAGPAARAVSEALRELFSPEQLDHSLAQLPKSLRAVLLPGEPPAQVVAEEHVHTRLRDLKQEIDLLADAISSLARGLEQTPFDEPGGHHCADAARSVHRILLARATP